jgi:nitrite reductase/ring-hydroxylating ferredoxin subunit/uncharacterized membrane protein
MALAKTSEALAPHLGTNIEQLLKAIPGFEGGTIAVARALHEAVLRGGETTRGLADLLHGVWLGHSLHAVLVEVPVGSWSAAALFDLIGLLGDAHEARWAADALITLGVAAAVPAALAGMADYSAIKEDAAATAGAHAMLNSAALGLFLLSLAARRGGRRGVGVLLALGALTIAGGSAWLGGDMVYRKRVGVNHTPEPSHAEGWIAVLGADELGVGEARRVQLGDDPVMLYRSAETVYAIGAVCSHAGGPLEQGELYDGCVECPWHQSVFDLRDGRVVHGPATMPQPRYETRVINGLIELRRPADLQQTLESAGPSSGQERAVGQ